MIKEVTRVTEDEKIIEISKILTAWNPLGEHAAAMKDLDNYRLEILGIHSQYLYRVIAGELNLGWFLL